MFSLVCDAILANTVLSAKFDKSRIVQFEPKHKAAQALGFPYFWANIPSMDSTKLVLNNEFTMKEFSVPVLLRIDWVRRDRVLEYSNAFVKAIGDYDSVFGLSGYYEVLCDVININPGQVVDGKEIVEAEFELSFKGHVAR